MPAEIETIAPQHAGWRTRELDLFRSGAVAKWYDELGIATIGYREIRRPWQESATKEGLPC